MNVRPLAWYDLPSLLLHRQQTICLDQIQLLTCGNPANLGSVSSSIFDPSGRFTAIIEATSRANHTVGQVVHQSSTRTANLSFLLMDDPGQMEDLPALIDFLSFHTGEAGALNLKAQLEENHPVYEILRRCGFSVYGVQTLWKLPARRASAAPSDIWREAQAVDEQGMRNLYQSLTPPVEQAAEPFQSNLKTRLVNGHDQEISIWVEYRVGSKGLYLLPVIPPSTQDTVAVLNALIELVSLVNKPAYIQVRSHQSWLHNALEEIGAEPSGRFNLLVKHLAIAQKVLVPNGLRSRVERAQVKPTVPIIQSITGDTSAAKTKETG